MIPSETTNLLDSESLSRGTTAAPTTNFIPTFVVGLLGGLVGAALVTFLTAPPPTVIIQQPDVDPFYTNKLSLLGQKHKKKQFNKSTTEAPAPALPVPTSSSIITKEVIDPGNWIEAFGVSRAVLVGTEVSYHAWPPPPKTLYVSGQTALHGTDTTTVGNHKTSMGGQLSATIVKVDATLALANMTKCDIVKIMTFVTSTDDVLAVWNRYETWMADCPIQPANTLVAIASLFRPDALIEMDVTAIH